MLSKILTQNTESKKAIYPVKVPPVFLQHAFRRYSSGSIKERL